MIPGGRFQPDLVHNRDGSLFSTLHDGKEKSSLIITPAGAPVQYDYWPDGRLKRIVTRERVVLLYYPNDEMADIVEIPVKGESRYHWNIPLK